MIKSAIRRFSVLLPTLLVTTMLNAFNSSTDHLLSGTPICSSYEADPELAFDNNASTSFSSASDYDMQWVGLDLGEKYVITRVSYTPSSGYWGADKALLCLFEGANREDFMDAIPLYLITQTPANGTATTADVNVSRGFRYVRFVGGCDCVDYNWNYSDCDIAELKFYGHAGEGDDTQFYQITNLPTLSIHVEDNIFPSERKEDFDAQSVLIYDGGTLKQEYPIYFRRRGNYPEDTANKSYRIKYNDVVDGKAKSHHMMRYGKNESPAKAKKWVLISSYRDKTLMRNPVAWAMSKRGERQWTPWSQVVDLIVNGDYRGTYTLADAVTVDSKRIDITEMTEEDIDDDFITGGYALEVDNRWDGEPENCKFKSTRNNPITIDSPDEDVIQPEQRQYIRNAWNNMEDIIFGANSSDPTNGIRSILDLDTFLKWFLISEFNGNTDMICQVFMYKERLDDLFYTGPIWDADLALENDANTYPANDRMDWTYKVRHTGHFDQFVSKVISDPYVFSRLQEIWTELRDKGNFDPEDVAADVDSLRNELRSSASLNHVRWPYLNQYIDLNPAVPGFWEDEVDRVRNYVRDRVTWMDTMLSYGTLRQENGVYQIASALDLCTFSKMVNENGETGARAALVADIDMTDYNNKFHPIGTSTNYFSGSFDGKGHTIRNLQLSGNDALGLFGYTGNCLLSNIVFDSTCSATGREKVGMLVGYAYSGNASISGVENHGTVTASSYFAGGIVGYVYSTALASVTNCSNTGSVTAPGNAAAIIGASAGQVSVANSYNIGTVSGAPAGKDFAYGNSGTTINNCWDYTSTQTSSMTSAQVDNGWLCYHINTNAGSNIWRQNIDNGKTHDAWPVLKNTSGQVFEKEGGFTNYNPNPVGFRYYNLVITELQGGSSGCIQFSEFDILDEKGDEVEDLEIYGGTESDISAENWGNLADNSVNSKYCKSNYNSYAYFLFDANSQINLCGYRIYTANDTQDHPDRNPSSWKLYGSNTQLSDPDDPDWILIDELNDDHTLPAANYTPTDFFISEPQASLTLSEHSTTLVRGETVQLQVSINPSSLQNMTLQWSTSNPSVATVNDQGFVMAKGVGTANISVSAIDDSSLSDVCEVTVVATQPGYRYYQFAIEATGGADVIQMSEFDILDKNGNDVSSLSTYAYTGSSFGGESQENLFDDDIYSKYCGSFNGTTLYIFMDAGTRVEPSGYRITTANDNSSYNGRSPITWSLFGGNTKSEDPNASVWTLLDHHENDRTIQEIDYTPFSFNIPEIVIGDLLLDENASTDIVAHTYDNVTLRRPFVQGWNTVCLPFAINNIEGFFGDEARAYEFDSFTDGELGFSLVSSLEASQPYVIYVPAAIADDIVLTNVAIDAENINSSNSVVRNRYYFCGTYAPFAAGEWQKVSSNDDIYIVTTDGTIVKAGAGVGIKGFRAYFDMPAATIVESFNFDDFETELKSIKRIKSDDEAIYNLAGQRIGKMRKGVNIINGKKILK